MMTQNKCAPEQATEEDHQEAKRLILSDLGRPGSGSEWEIACIEATVDLSLVLPVYGFGVGMRWPLEDTIGGQKCRLPGPDHEHVFDETKMSSDYVTDSERDFDEYTSRVTPKYMKYYGYNTALLTICPRDGVFDVAKWNEVAVYDWETAVKECSKISEEVLMANWPQNAAHNESSSKSE